MAIIRVLLSLFLVGCVGAAFLFLVYLVVLICRDNKKSDMNEEEE